MKKKTYVSKDDIFADLGLEDSEEMKTRSDLMSEIVHLIRKSGIPQKEVAIILGITQPKISSLMSGKINDFSTDTLMQYLTLLGCNVEIRVRPCHRLSRHVKKGNMMVQKRPITRRKKVSSNI